MKNNMMTEENRKAVNAIMETMADNDAHHGKSDTADALACNRYFADGVTARAEAYVCATKIDVYAGNATKLFEHFTTLNDERVKVRVKKQECIASFKDIDTLKEVITAYNANQAKSKTPKKRSTKKANNAKKETKTA